MGFSHCNKHALQVFKVFEYAPATTRGTMTNELRNETSRGYCIIVAEAFNNYARAFLVSRYSNTFCLIKGACTAIPFDISALLLWVNCSP